MAVIFHQTCITLYCNRIKLKFEKTGFYFDNNNQDYRRLDMPYFIIIALVLIIDQLSKYLTIAYLKPIRSYPLINNIFHLTYAENTGAAFSILRDKQLLLIISTLIIITALLFYLIKNLKTDQVLLKFSLPLIIGGALGNLIDRIRLGYVVDMLDFTLINFAIFNMADVFVVLGVILFTYSVLTSSTDNSIDSQK